MMNNKSTGFTLIEVVISTVLVGFLILTLVLFSRSFFSSYDFAFEETRILSEAQYAVETIEREIKEMQNGVDGSYPLVTASNQEVVFYADIDNDNTSERVRYYLIGTDLIKQVFEYEEGLGNYACAGGCDVCHNPGADESTLTLPESAWPAHAAAHGDYIGVCVPGGGSGGSGSSSAYEEIVASYVVNDTLAIFTFYNGDWPGDEIQNPLIESARLLESRLLKIDLLIDTDTQDGPDVFNTSTLIHLRNLKDNL